MSRTQYLIRSVDLETSRKGTPADGAEIVEMGWTDLIFTPETKEVVVDPTYNSLLFKPANGMTVDTVAVHHITEAMVAEMPVCEDTHKRILLMGENGAMPGPPAFIVAHNAEFEREFLTDEIIPGRRWLCTYKTGLRALPESPNHKLHTLRYHLGLELPEAQAMPPHRAGPDSFVGAHVLANLLRRGVRVADMTNWFFEPKWMPTCPLAKHRGKRWPDVPADYLDWIINKATDMDADTKHWARVEIARRHEALANPTTKPAEEGDDYV